MLGRKRRICALIASVVTVSTVSKSTISLADSLKENNISTNTSYSEEMLNAMSSRYTKPETYAKVENRLSVDGFEKVMEDSKVEVWHKSKDASMRVVDKASGYVWGGLSEEKPEDMNKTWSGVGNALVSIDYFDNKGIEKRLSIADSKVKKSHKVNGNKLTYSVNYKDLGISFDFAMELNDGAITFSLDDSTIVEEKDFSLGAVYFVPFLGSTKADEIDGYMFVPDGPGALMRFKKPSEYLINFDKRIYGKDYGIDKLTEVNDLKSSRPNDFITEEPSILMPVFGVVHGVEQNAVFAEIGSGAEYASIVATPSGMLTDYNWVTGKFVYRQKYLQPTSRNGAGVQVVQKERNSFNAEITYQFLTNKEADYVGMAKLYRENLKEQGILAKEERIDSSIPLQLDIITSDIEKGFLSNKVKELTSTDDMKNIVEELSTEGVDNVTMVLQGWQKGGVGGSKPSQFKFESAVGSEKEIKEVEELVKSKGGNLYYHENPTTLNESQIDMREEAGKSLSQVVIKLTRENDNLWFKDTYFVEPTLSSKYVTEKSEKYKENNMGSMALEGFGSKLYAENEVNNVTTRKEAKALVQEAGEKVSSNVEKVSMYGANEYMWSYIDEMFATPMVNSQYLFETDTVPFLQMVLKGSVDYYAPYSNISFYSKADLLKMVEYGSYPSFLLTGVSNSDLAYTTKSELYSTRYEDWKERIVEIYNYVNEPISKTEGKEIVDRAVLATGVVKVDYEGDLSIIVNYTDKAYNHENVEVEALSYRVLGGE